MSDLLRISTAGSVDDGKSTLIGRLLCDTKSIFEDQLEAVERASRDRGDREVDLALLTDGLRAEREQGITIDVAYRYFATPRRSFIVADTPGHVQYTRNMVTGASTSDLAVVLIDARQGVLTQSKRHGFIASLLGLPHMVVAVNKMDLVDYSEEVFNQIVADYTDFSAKLGIHDVRFIPISALRGDNVVERGPNMDWYGGPTLLYHLETVSIAADRNLVDFRFPVQLAIRPHQDFRGLAGTVASGSFRVGDEVLALPSGVATTVKTIQTAGGMLDTARAGEAVVVELADDLDVSRGDMLVRSGNLPEVASDVDAMVCWMSERPLAAGRAYLLRHTTREVQAVVEEIRYRVDVDTLHREAAGSLGLNDIARVRLSTAQPLFFDAYTTNRETGGFILIDPQTHDTVAAGMIRGEARDATDVIDDAAQGAAPVPAPAPAPVPAPAADVVWEPPAVPREEREARAGHRAAVVWFTGLSGAGKSTIARALERTLFDAGVQTALLDGDVLRHGLARDLGFSPADRRENVRRAGEAARLFFEHGAVVLCAFVSPQAADRDAVRALFPAGRFFEVHVDLDVDTARARDPKGLYRRADAGEVKSFTGVSAPYERPARPDLTLRTAEATIEDSVDAVVAMLTAAGVLKA